MRHIHLPTKARMTSDLVPDVAMTHGQAVWVLSAMGFSEGVTKSTFNHYIKSLRKLGLPFARGEHAERPGRLVHYSYNHLMELSVALTLRIYGTLPDRVLEGIIQFRRDLYALYRRAYLEYDTGLGAVVSISAKNRSRFEMSGLYLDLRIRFGGGRILEFGPPRVLSPFEAIRVYSKLDTPGRAHLPFNLSAMAINLVDLTVAAPKMRGGSPDHPR